jgi:putative ABC transport system substrate-binding protein
MALAAVAALTAPGAQTPDPGKKDTPYKIYMVLWRGVTDAEKGFIDYFSRQGIDADFMIRSCQKDRTKFPFANQLNYKLPDKLLQFTEFVR